jgi:cell surface protein SprA
LFNDELSDIAGLFNTYEDYRSVISTRLYPTGDNHETNGAQYKEGYGRKQPEVLIPAFLAAYTGKDPNDVKLNLFDQTPLPNWSLNYNGLSRLPMFKDLFRNVSIRHSYNSTLQVNRFQSNGKYEENAPLSDDNKNEDFNFYSEYYFPELQMRESMSPLIGLSIKTTNDISFDLDYSKTRELSLNFTNSFLHETRSESITVNFGYLIKDVNIGFLSFELDDLVSGSRRSSNNNSGSKVNRGQDMNIAIAFTYGDDVTLTHQLDIDRSPTPERGIKTIRINPTIEYDMNKYMNLQAYFEYSYSEPATSQSFPITNMRGGLRLRFKLQ